MPEGGFDGECTFLQRFTWQKVFMGEGAFLQWLPQGKGPLVSAPFCKGWHA